MRLHRSVRALLVTFITVLPAGASADAGTDAVKVGNLHRQILEILHGEPRSDVSPTLYYCARRGLIPVDPNASDLDWYFEGKGRCSVAYVPNLASIHSPLSHGGEIRHFFFDEAKHQLLEQSLTQLAANLKMTPLSLGDRFDLQMTLWELVKALQTRRNIRVTWDPEISQPKVDRLLVPALRALQATLFTPEQIEALPATLPRLAKLAGEPAIEPWARRLLAGDETILEDLFPQQLHGAFAGGRLFSRVFLSLNDTGEMDRLRGYLNQRDNLRLEGFSWQSAPPLAKDQLTADYHRDLVNFPLRYTSIHTILILFFNVLDTRYEVVPTRMVASWQELWFSAKVENQQDLRAVDRLVGMRIVNYQKQLGLRAAASVSNDFPVYRPQSEDAVSRVLLTDVNPVFPNTEVTTVRGQCLTCHSGRILTVDRRLRKAGFSRPFALRPDELYDRQVEIKVGEAFRNWSVQYLGETEERP